MQYELNNQEDVYNLFYSELNGWKTTKEGPLSVFLTKEPFGEVVRFLDWIKPRLPAGTVLDIGCGGGRHSVLFAKAGYTVTGIDYSQKAVALAKQLAEENNVSADFIKTDIFSFQSNHRYDIVMDMGCLHHIEPEQRLRYVECVDKLTKPGSYLLQIQFKINPLSRNVKEHYNYNNKHYTYYFGHRELARLFDRYTVMLEKTGYYKNILFTIVYFEKNTETKKEEK